VEKFIETVKQISPTFGGINLEDIKAPECFEIEDRLKKELDIPIMHDDQHGTAIISGAGLLNALELVNKKIEDIKIVVCGAGASAISCTRLYIALGVRPENILMSDSKGILHPGRTDINETKKEFVRKKIQLCNSDTATVFITGATFMTAHSKSNGAIFGIGSSSSSSQAIESVSVVAKDGSGQVLLSASYDNKDRQSASTLAREFGSALADKLK